MTNLRAFSLLEKGLIPKYITRKQIQSDLHGCCMYHQSSMQTQLFHMLVHEYLTCIMRAKQIFEFFYENQKGWTDIYLKVFDHGSKRCRHDVKSNSGEQIFHPHKNGNWRYCFEHVVMQTCKYVHVHVSSRLVPYMLAFYLKYKFLFFNLLLVSGYMYQLVLYHIFKLRLLQ